MVENIKITTYTQTEAITLTQAKDHLQILDTSFDILIGDYITSAHVMLWNESKILVDGIALGFIPSFQDFIIPFGEVASFEIFYYDSNNARQTLADTEYITSTGFYTSVEMVTEPTTFDREFPYEIEVTTAVNVDPMVIQALRMIVADFFESRQTNEVGNIRDVKRTTKWQLDLISKRVEI